MNKNYAHFILLLKRLALVFTIFTICRFLFFLFNAHAFRSAGFGNIINSFFTGLRFDASAIIYVFSPVILLHIIPVNVRNTKTWQLITKSVFAICVFICVFLNLVDTGYFTFSGRRSGFELIKMQSAQNASPLIYLLDYWYLFLILIALIYSSWRFYPKLNDRCVIKSAKQFAVQFLYLIITLTIAFAGARGSFGLKPLNTLDAARLTSAELMPLTLNTPFQILLTFEQVTLEHKDYMSDEEAARIFNPEKTVSDSSGHSGKNVVVIIVESLGKEYVGYYNNGIGYTPFIDSLMQFSTVYENAYANGKKSIEGIPAITAAIPSWMPDDFMNSVYKANKIHSTGFYLDQQGYDASFYHGGKNGTMSFDQFIANTGAGRYYGLNEYPYKKDFDGNWGVFDEPYLQYFAAELNNKKAPFYSVIFTLSSHHPYKIPDQHKGKFKGGELPIYATVEYVDYALKRFFESAEKMPWYKNTLFVVSADHSSENRKIKYINNAGKYAIPLFIFDPSQPVKKVVDQTVSQLNINDEILNRSLPVNSKYFSFASDIAVQFEGGLYQAIRYPYVLKFDGENPTGFYNLGNDSLMIDDLLNEQEYKSQKDSLTLELKALIQQYNNRLISNTTH